MKITLVELEELDACYDGLQIFKDSHPSGASTLLEALDSNGVDDVLWYLDNNQTLTVNQRADINEWTRKQALIVAHLIESDEKDLIIHFLKTGDNAAEAEEAAVASALSSRAARAARASAWAAAWAARAAAWAARASAWASARAAAGTAAIEKQAES